MIQVNNSEIFNFSGALRGMRQPLNSHHKSDSNWDVHEEYGTYYYIGENDMNLCKRLIKGGTEHRKFLRQVMVSVDITAPLYWWKEFDTYKVGTTANSTSTMHKIHSKPFEVSDFSFDDGLDSCDYAHIVNILETLRQEYVETKNKNTWRALIQLLPSAYNQTRTVTLNYEILMNIHNQRKHHKLSEWHTLCDWIESLPYMKEWLECTSKKCSN